MANYRYKAKITDDVIDATDILKSLHRSVHENKIDKPSALHNIENAIKKLESAKYYIDRE
jgi:hypothetical protein